MCADDLSARCGMHARCVTCLFFVGKMCFQTLRCAFGVSASCVSGPLSSIEAQRMHADDLSVLAWSVKSRRLQWNSGVPSLEGRINVCSDSRVAPRCVCWRVCACEPTHQTLTPAPTPHTSPPEFMFRPLSLIHTPSGIASAILFSMH